MKNLTLLVLIVILAAGGYLIFQKKSPTLEPEHIESSKITKQQAVENVKNLPNK